MKPKEREIKTVGVMIDIYCRHHHGTNHGPYKPFGSRPGDGKLCDSCRKLAAYANQRTLNCPFGEEKPACGKCRVHCYKPQMQAEIRKVMKFSGPKMITSHPVLAIGHLITTFKEAPEKKKPK